MPKRSSKPDINQLAAAIVNKSTSEGSSDHKVTINSVGISAPTEEADQSPIKNPAAVALGRLGGLKGGKIRARNLTAERRKKIAADAAKARWKKHKPRD